MRQAVVVIHGIGEQKPMGTIRPFVEAVLGANGQKGKFWSKPDQASELFELRRLQAHGSRTIHFYEYYWAYNLEGSNLFDVLYWATTLALRPWKSVPFSTRSIWLLTQLLAVLVLVGIGLGGATAVTESFELIPKFGVIWIAVVLTVALTQFYLISYLGDAARYLSPRPRNIKLRQKIRSEGINLLRRLHERGEYDRIVLVGHSLGSVIGYDVLTHLWQEYHKELPALQTPKFQKLVRDAMANKSTLQPIIQNKLLECGGRLTNAPGQQDDFRETQDEFRKTQSDALQEIRQFGNPWLITDFVTLGSPLTHAVMLLASSRCDFEARKSDRELMTCPPQDDDGGYAYSSPDSFNVGYRKEYKPLILHHAAAFAVTRWTNLYMPARFGLFGDIVGGPLATEFGPGVKDVAVSTGRWKGFAKWTLAAHTSYWRTADEIDVRDSEIVAAIIALREAMAL